MVGGPQIPSARDPPPRTGAARGRAGSIGAKGTGVESSSNPAGRTKGQPHGQTGEWTTHFRAGGVYLEPPWPALVRLGR